MKQERDKSFVWISWLAKLLAGEIQCEFACWFKCHYKYDKIPNDFNLVRWTMDHNQLVHKTRDELEKQGYKVFIEDQNALKVDMHGTCVSAKPDIVAIKDDEKLVVDCKTGRSKNSDHVQVMLYMMFLEGEDWKGRIVYKTTSIPIPSVALNKSFTDLVENTVKKLGFNNSTLSRRVPSENECRRCDITKEDCPERLEDDGQERKRFF